MDEWLPASSPRLAKLNTKSNGSRGILFPDNVVFDQEIVVNGDESDPVDVCAVLRPVPRRSAYHVANLNHFLGSGCNGAARFMARVKDMENPIPLDVRCLHVPCLTNRRGAPWLAHAPCVVGVWCVAGHVAAVALCSLGL